jgi:uncharacterized membrane protein
LISLALTERAIIACNGPQSPVARAIGRDWKGWCSIALYVIAVPLAYHSRWMAVGIYITVIVLWLNPDRRIVRVLEERSE